jgi:hypothetical protein
MSEKKQYIGDGVYLDFDKFDLILTTENGVEATNTIYLDFSVFTNLVDFAQKIGWIE